MFRGHPLCFGRVLLPLVRVGHVAGILRLGLDGGCRGPPVAQRREGAFLPEAALAVGRRVREDGEVLFVVRVGALDQLHP